MIRWCTADHWVIIVIYLTTEGNNDIIDVCYKQKHNLGVPDY